VVYTPNLDAVSEFEVLTNDYDAEYGQVIAGTISLELKSGGNQFHGTAFDFLRNDVLDARNYFLFSATALRPPLEYNQFGYSLGGPIRKDKLFFFVDTQWTRDISRGVTISSVPTPAMRAGDFSYDTSPIYDPATTQVSASGAIIRAPFPGNVIPADRIDPIAKGLTTYWPEPNLPGTVNNYSLVSPCTTIGSSSDIRIDYDPRASDTITGRFSYSDPTTIEAAAIEGPASPNSSYYERTTNPGFEVSETHIFSPQLVNELRAGLQDSEFYSSPGSAADEDWRSTFGMPSLFGSNLQLQYNFPEIDIAGITSLGSPFNYLEWRGNTLQFNDMLTWTKGKHLLKFGGSLSHIYMLDHTPFFPAGEYDFTGVFTGLPSASNPGVGFADFLSDDSSIAYAGLLHDGGMKFTHYEMAGFVQDDYRVDSRLTLNLGLGCDVETPYTVTTTPSGIMFRAQTWMCRTILRILSIGIILARGQVSVICLVGTQSSGEDMAFLTSRHLRESAIGSMTPRRFRRRRSLVTTLPPRHELSNRISGHFRLAPYLQ
jgi:hypothetical protein